MPTLPCIGSDDCRGLKPRMFAVNHAATGPIRAPGAADITIKLNTSVQFSDIKIRY